MFCFAIDLRGGAVCFCFWRGGRGGGRAELLLLNGGW